MSTSQPDLPIRFEPASRVAVERRIFLGDDSRALFADWLKTFANDYALGRLEGYVLDLAQGALLAALDCSPVAQEVYDDIAVLVCEPDDARAAAAFLHLVQDCNPSTMPNRLCPSFDV